MKNQTHNFELSPIHYQEHSGFKVTVTSQELLEMYQSAKRRKEHEHQDVPFEDICRWEAIHYVTKFVEKNYPEFSDGFYFYQHEHCCYEIAMHIENALGEVSEREEMEEMEEKLKDQ
jgi:hypothetical protein